MTSRRLSMDHVDPASLVPAPYNPRSITPEARSRLRRGIEQFGLLVPLLARRQDRLVIGGHQRLAIMLELGATEVPVIWAEDLADEEVAALTILLNNPEAQGEWDLGKLSPMLSELDGHGYDATLTGFDEGQLERFLTWSPAPASSASMNPTPASQPSLVRFFELHEIPIAEEDLAALELVHTRYQQAHGGRSAGFVKWLLEAISTHLFFG